MNRRDFLLSGCAQLLACAALPPLLASEPRAEPHRGGRVGWARLKTQSPHWTRHTGSDSLLSDFIRTQTTLNMDPEWCVADLDQLDELCAYPLIFSTSIVPAATPAGLKNLAEYLGRGGFLFVDSCINWDINADPDLYLRENSDVFRRLLPGCDIRRLPDDHPIYTCYFPIEARPPHTYCKNIFDARWKSHGLYGVYMKERLASLVSVSGLQCGWDGMISPPGHRVECMKMVVNIYVTAMTG